MNETIRVIKRIEGPQVTFYIRSESQEIPIFGMSLALYESCTKRTDEFVREVVIQVMEQETGEKHVYTDAALLN